MTELAACGVFRRAAGLCRQTARRRRLCRRLRRLRPYTPVRQVYITTGWRENLGHWPQWVKKAPLCSCRGSVVKNADRFSKFFHL